MADVLSKAVLISKSCEHTITPSIARAQKAKTVLKLPINLWAATSANGGDEPFPRYFGFFIDVLLFFLRATTICVISWPTPTNALTMVATETTVAIVAVTGAAITGSEKLVLEEGCLMKMSYSPRPY